MPFVILLAALALAVLLLVPASFRVAFYNPIPRREDPRHIPSAEQYQRHKDRILELIDAFEAIPYEALSIRSQDGLRLFGRYYHVRDGAPILIEVHGYHGTALRDFCGGNLLARAAGYNTLVIDQRAHGKSEGKIISLGINEREDCLLWAEYAAGRWPGVPLILSGVSMGAATVLMASSLPLPESVRGIMADCPYSAPDKIIRKVCGDKGVSGRFFGALIALSGRVFGRFDIRSASPLEAVKQARVPILLIHGEDDRYVPCSMSAEIAAACASPVRLETFPHAGHGLSYMEDEARYARIFSEFMAELKRE